MADNNNFYEYSSEDILKYVSSQCNINMDTVLEDMNAKKKQEVLKQHTNKIYQQKDGRWCTYIIENGVRKAIRVSSKDRLEDRLYEYYVSQDQKTCMCNSTLEEIFDEWLQYKSLHVKKQTVVVIRSIWNKYYTHSNIIKEPIKCISKLMLDEWIHSVIREHEMDKSHYTNFVSVIKQMLDYAVDKEIIASSPYKSVKIDTRRVLKPRQKRADREQVFFPEEEKEFETLALNDFEKRLHPVNQLAPIASLFLFYTGLRVGELCTLRYSDIVGDYIIVQRFYNNSMHKVEQGLKSNHSYRKVPLPTRAKDLIEMARTRQINENVYDENRYIFSMDDSPLSYDAAIGIFYQYCKQMGSYPKGPHCARKTFISRLIDAGVNINTIRRIVGHNDERTTLNNYCYDRHNEDE